MNHQAYLSRFARPEGTLGQSEAEFLSNLADLNEAEWCDLLGLVLREDFDAYKVFLPPRGESLVSHAAALIDRLGAADRKRPAQALERVTNVALQDGEMDIVYRGLFLAGLFGDSSTLSFLKSLTLGDFPQQVRERAAGALTNHASVVPPVFWKNLGVAREPFLLPAAVIGLALHAPDEALLIVEKAANDRTVAALQYPLRLAVQRLLASEPGRIRLTTTVEGASGAFADMLRLIIESEGVSLDAQPALSSAEQDLKRMGLPPELAPEYEFDLVVPRIAHYLKAVDGSIRNKPLNDVEGILALQLVKVPSDRSVETAIRLGKAITEIKIERKLGDSDIHKRLWPALVNSSERPDSRVGSLFAAHCMRLQVCSYASAKLKLPDEKLFQCMYALKDLRSQAKMVKETAPSKLFVAASLYHEDQIFAALLKLLLSRVDYYRLEVVPRDWGTLSTPDREADFGFVSELDDENVSSLFGGDRFPSIYQFLGYYVFARRAWLEGLASSGGSRQRNIAQNVLKPRTGKPGSRTAINSRAWLVRDFVGSVLDEVAEAPRKTFEEQRVEKEFERFVSGQANVFLGGAVHARLIQRWWCSEEVPRAVEILNPSDVQTLNGNKPTRNGLLFRDELRKGKYKRFRIALARLYKGIAMLLTTAVKSRDPEADRLFGHLTAILAEADSRGDERNTKWAFVSDPEDLRLLLSRDNVFDTTDLKPDESARPTSRAHAKTELTVLKPRGRA
jgi:hypothetical protein